MARIFAIPDIHGRKDLLERLLTALRDEHKLDLSVDKLIFLGDMIDRGPDSKGVLDICRKLKEDHPANVVALRGNHDQFMVNCFRKGRFDDWALWFHPANGGSETIKSFGLSFINGLPEGKIPEEYISWIESLPNYHEEPGFFFSHAPVPKEKDRKWFLQGKPFTEEELTWTYFEDEKGKSRHHKDKDGKDVVGVCGHIHRLQRGLFTPRHYQHYLFLDAGCGCSQKAPLVCTEVISRTIIDVWPEGVTPIVPKSREYIPQGAWERKP
jgi:Icc-related predicted phosphoesterase